MTAIPPASSPSTPPFDPQRPYELDPQVSIRPEPFGGLAYNYGNRRLTLITSRRLVDVVRSLAAHATARDAVAGHVPEASRDRYESALRQLLASGVIRAR